MRLFLMALLAVALVACGAVATPSPTTPPPTPVPPTAVPPSPTTAPAPAQAAAAASDARWFTVDPEQTDVVLRVKEQLADNTVNTDAELRTKAISGRIGVLPNGKVAEGSKLTVDLSTLKSDRSMRDQFVKFNVLQTRQFPNAEFVPKELRGVASPPPKSGPIQGELVGDMTVHGVTKPVTIKLDGTLDDGGFKGKATTEMKITDFGMPLPKVPVVASMEDLGRLEVNLVAKSA